MRSWEAQRGIGTRPRFFLNVTPPRPVDDSWLSGQLVAHRVVRGYANHASVFTIARGLFPRSRRYVKRINYRRDRSSNATLKLAGLDTWWLRLSRASVTDFREPVVRPTSAEMLRHEFGITGYPPSAGREDGNWPINPRHNGLLIILKYRFTKLLGCVERTRAKKEWNTQWLYLSLMFYSILIQLSTCVMLLLLTQLSIYLFRKRTLSYLLISMLYVSNLSPTSSSKMFYYYHQLNYPSTF